jgi:hypothetical protein
LLFPNYLAKYFVITSFLFPSGLFFGLFASGQTTAVKREHGVLFIPTFLTFLLSLFTPLNSAGHGHANETFIHRVRWMGALHVCLRVVRKKKKIRPGVRLHALFFVWVALHYVHIFFFFSLFLCVSTLLSFMSLSQPMMAY